jgi:hypothetical protein
MTFRVEHRSDFNIENLVLIIKFHQHY